jgi:glyoxylase-like metal-dependent hydrolase (beta-lactamase superfamily II)
MRLGDLDVKLVDDGGFRLDGGAMFGVVPRTLWEREKPPDERNRIRMTTNCPLVERGGELVLIDTGIGDKNDDKFRKIFGLEPGARRLPEAIRDAGYELGDVTHVLLTHLHFDHAGWNARDDGAGRLVPTFPNARYWIERGELEHARSPNLRDRASYDPRNWEPLLEAGVVELFDGEAEPVPGVRAVKAPGHNRDLCIVLLGEDGAGERAVFWADLVPTSAHVPYPWIMGYDLYPLTTLENKQLWLPRAAEGGWLSIFEHDPEVPLARLAADERGRLVPEPVTLPDTRI